MFDEAENYADGKSELELGRALKEFGIRRADFVITSKVRVLHFHASSHSLKHLEGLLGHAPGSKQHGTLAQTVRHGIVFETSSF